jgi:hypothetical protein
MLVKERLVLESRRWMIVSTIKHMYFYILLFILHAWTMASQKRHDE